MAISARRTSSFSQETSITQGSGEGDGEIYQTTFSAEVATGPVEADPGSTATAVATVDAIAAGTSTVTAGGVGLSVDTSGVVSSGSATAEVTAMAYSEGDLFAYAAADASASLSGISGAGFSLDWNSTSFSQDSQGTLSTATSEQTVIVVGTSPDGTWSCSDDDAPCGGWGEPSGDGQPFAAYSGWDPGWEWEEPEEHEPGFDDNSVYFWTFAEASGVDTFVSVDISALAMEDQLSLLNISAVAISA
jgi:hypothetical protein